MPLIVQSTKQTTTSFNLSIINSHMQMATKSTTTLAETKVAIVNMYQNGTTAKLSPQAQKAAQALANYIYVNKESKKFAFVLGKDHQDQQLLLLTISNHLAKTKGNAFLQKAIRQVPIDAQESQELSPAKQLPWVTKALQQAKFGILFWIYQHRLSSQEAIAGTTLVPSAIIAVNFQRVKTPQEQLQDKAWAKMIDVVRKLTSSQLRISANPLKLPSQTKISARTIVLALQNIITNNDKISKAAQKLIKAEDIRVEFVDKTGVIKITIQNYGHDKIIEISGFNATGSPLAIARAKIDAAMDGVILPTKSSQVSHGKMPLASNVNAPLKNGVTFTFQSATTVNKWGASTLTYEVDANPQVDGANSQEVTFVVRGFETQAQAVDRIAKLAQGAIQTLVARDFMTGIDKTKIASTGAPTQAHVITDIKKQINNSDAQALILPGDITITAGNITQTITIVIHNHGPSKTITIVGFRSIKDYLDQLLNTIPSSGGPWVIPKGITSVQFDMYVQAMGNVLNEKGKVVMNKFAEQYRAKITSLTIPNSFTMIGSWFQDFDKITSLHIPNSVTAIGTWAFANSPLITLSLGAKLQTIGNSAFQKAQLTSLHIPNSVITIGFAAFGLSPLTILQLGNHLQTIGKSAFLAAQLRSLIIPNSVITIGHLAFQSSPLTSLQLGNHLQTIGNYAFYRAQLRSLIIPNSVTAIGDVAFGSSPIASINIFKGVKVFKTTFKTSVKIIWIRRTT